MASITENKVRIRIPKDELIELIKDIPEVKDIRGRRRVIKYTFEYEYENDNALYVTIKIPGKE